jgi:Protein of unknown function (DUF3987)
VSDEEVRRTVDALFKPKQVVELRTFFSDRTFSGYYSDREKLVEDAAKREEAGHELYVTANEIDPALLGRAANRIRRVYKDPLTSDNDVRRRRWLLVDMDPVRPAKISSTDEEKAEAYRLAREALRYLRGQGWPSPYVGDSGNGYHLLYQIDLPNDQESRELVKGVLEALSFMFSCESAKVDTSTHNAARVWKLYGTTARKGDSIEERPHRPARLLQIPEEPQVVGRSLLEAVAAQKPREEFDPKANGGRSPQFDVAGWIADHGVRVKRAGPWSRGGYRWILEECPWNGHADNSAYIVQGGHGGISAGCHHNSCQVYGWRDLREHYEPGCYDRRSSRFTGGGGSMGASSATFAPPPSWPELRKAALQGLPGDVVRTFGPHTEADPVAVLLNLLCAFGNAVGRGAFARVGTTEHHLKLFVGLVGETAKGRKGESWGPVRALFEAVYPGWAAERVMGGLSSGEGLIYAVRDEVRGERKGEEVVLDPGEPDKRLLALEGELARVLKAMAREGNTLSPTVRQAWDGDRLRTLTKNSPTKSTGAHISIIGHVTKAELLRHLSDTEAANGFANRFQWYLVRRSKELPFGGTVPPEELAEMSRLLDSAIRFGRKPRPVRWGESAREPWREVYGPLSEGKPGLFGAVVGRAEAQTLRLAALYAVMDESEVIEYEHLAAALALWDYAEESAGYIFGDATGDPVADDIAEALRAAGEAGLSSTEIRDLFGRNKNADRINGALGLLLKLGRVRQESEPTGGRPVERWFSK